MGGGEESNGEAAIRMGVLPGLTSFMGAGLLGVVPISLHRKAASHMLTVLFETSDFRVVDKPAGCSVLRDNTGAPSLGEIYPSQFQEPPLFVHRLDKGTSGALIVARTAFGRAHFQRAFARGEVEKTYLALVDGVPESAEGVIRSPLEKARKGKFRIAESGGTSAVTDYRFVDRVGGQSLLIVRPKTGRTHQIRVHLASIGCPLVLDPLYGGSRGRPSQAPDLTLHAWRIRFHPPGSEGWTEVFSPPPNWAGDVSVIENGT